MFSQKKSHPAWRPENRNIPWGLLLIALFLLLSAYTIVNADPYLWVAIIFVILFITITKSNIAGFYLIVVSIFFADWLVELKLIPSQISWVPELVIILYFMKTFLIKTRRLDPRFFQLYIPFLFVVLLSQAVNFGEEHIITILFTFRLLFRYVILFYTLQVLPLRERAVKNLIRFILILLVIQIPVAVVKLFLYGQGESAIGTYAVSGGLYSTILPLIGISLFFGLFYFLKRRTFYILVCIGFVAFGIIGGKRGILFLVPALMIYLFLSLPRKTVSLRTRMVSYALLFVLLAMSVWAPLAFLNTLRDDPLGYAISYETATSRDQSIGRVSTTINVFNTLASRPKAFFFGFGPGSLLESYWSEYMGRIRRDVESFGFLYGITGFSWNAIEFGYLGAILFLLPIIHLYKINRRFLLKTEDAYWKALSFGLGGITAFSIVIHVVYGPFYRQDIPAFLLLFFGGLVYKMETQRNLGGEAEKP